LAWFSRKRRAVTAEHPLAKTADLLVEEFGDELLIYDQDSDHAHCLTPAASRVWGACDGRTSPHQLGTALDLDAATVARALAELDACGLLDEGPEQGVTRRQATAKLARIGAAAASAPLIYSITAPAPAMAASARFCATLACPAGGSVAAHRTFCQNAGCLLCQGTSCENGTNSGSVCVAICTDCTAVRINAKCGKTSCVLATPSACP